MKIGIFGLEEKDQIDFFGQNLKEFDVEIFNKPLDQNNLPENLSLEIISVFVDSKVSSDVINAFPNLKMITVRATGFDNVDIDYAKQKGIVVCNVPSYGSHTVAEYTFALILTLSRKIPLAIDRVKKEGKFEYQSLQGFDLYEKAIGVVGTGKIGANVIKIAQGFGMNVLAFDAFPNEELSSQLNFNYTSLDEVLKKSDIVTLHVPGMKETDHMINKDNITKMKKGSILINTSRGSVLETSALIEAIKSGYLKGAAVDVLEEERELKEQGMSYLEQKYGFNIKDYDNFIITPHTAFNTLEAEASIIQTTIENITNFIKGSAVNVVNK